MKLNTKINRVHHLGRCLVLSLLAGGLLLSGCTTGGHSDDMAVITPPQTQNPDGMPVMQAPPEYAASRSAEGSLWNDNRGSMFEDTRANYVGDTVIVDIVENSSSKMDVNTESGRKSSMDIGTPTINILGKKTQFGGSGTTSLINTSFGNSFSGEAESDRSGQVTASITARVIEVLPNGNLSLFGRRAMKVDHEVQYIVVSGIIRPEDISASNRVESTYMADARIEYFGKGALSDKQKPGWGTRIIDNIWPW